MLLQPNYFFREDPEKHDMADNQTAAISVDSEEEFDIAGDYPAVNTSNKSSTYWYQPGEIVFPGLDSHSKKEDTQVASNTEHGKQLVSGNVKNIVQNIVQPMPKQFVPVSSYDIYCGFGSNRLAASSMSENEILSMNKNPSNQDLIGSYCIPNSRRQRSISEGAVKQIQMLVNTVPVKQEPIEIDADHSENMAQLENSGNSNIFIPIMPQITKSGTSMTSATPKLINRSEQNSDFQSNVPTEVKPESSTESSKKINKIAVSFAGIYKCPYCVKSYRFSISLKRHIETRHLGRRFKCKHCETEFDSIAGLSSHNRMKHKQLMRFECHLCGMRFNTSSAMGQHVTRLHNGVM